MRYRTAATLSVVLIGGMFAVPAAIMAIFSPSLKQGILGPIPGYEHILLAVAIFFLSWRFVLALPIALIPFIVAAFTSASTVHQERSHPNSLNRRPMNRPVGITIIASLNILGGLALGVSAVLAAHPTEGGLAWILGLGVILGIGLGIALLSLQNWARAVVVVLYALSLIRLPGELLSAHSVLDVLASLVSGSYVVWAIWYMHQLQVKAVFGRQSLKS